LGTKERGRASDGFPGQILDSGRGRKIRSSGTELTFVENETALFNQFIEASRASPPHKPKEKRRRVDFANRPVVNNVETLGQRFPSSSNKEERKEKGGEPRAPLGRGFFCLRRGRRRTHFITPMGTHLAPAA